MTKVITRLFLTVSILISVISGASFAKDREVADNPQPFTEWLVDLKTEALEKGISEAVFDAAFDGLILDPKVISLDRRQPEFTQTYGEYIAKRVSPTRIKNGLKKIAENAEDLDLVSKKIGVQHRFIAGIWGMETNYGGYTGGYNVVRSLATLAYDMRRPEFFRSQLLGALRILEEGHITPDLFQGSWAGAMGQGQFMPTSFFAYAYDFDGDSKKDIWTNKQDVFASIGNYLKKHGWDETRTWGRQVMLPTDTASLWEKVKQTEKIRSCHRALKDHSKQLTLEEWQALGVRTIYGADLPKVSDPSFTASLVMPAGPEGPAFLTYKNFRAILSYNCSNYYALGVSLLSDELQ